MSGGSGRIYAHWLPSKQLHSRHQTFKALAWTACNSLAKIWRSALSRKLTIRLLSSTVESLLLYGCEACETWTLKKSLESKLDGCYTRLLRAALSIKRSDRVIVELYGEVPRATTKIKSRRLKLAGHCFRHSEEMVGPVDSKPCNIYQTIGEGYLYEISRDTDSHESWGKLFCHSLVSIGLTLMPSLRCVGSSVQRVSTSLIWYLLQFLESPHITVHWWLNRSTWYWELREEAMCSIRLVWTLVICWIFMSHTRTVTLTHQLNLGIEVLVF